MRLSIASQHIFADCLRAEKPSILVQNGFKASFRTGGMLARAMETIPQTMTV
jgi:hypothetical protein